MRQFFLMFFCACVCLVNVPAGALTITKAETVAPTETSSDANATSLIPTVLGLISNVQQLNQKQKQLTAECIPSNQEITFVDNIIKEWAKTGVMSADEVQRRLGRRPCPAANGGYRAAVQLAAGTEMEEEICYDHFSGGANVGMVWEGFPKVGLATYCEDGSLSCADKKTVSDIYDIFNLVTFSEADYTADELKMASRLMTKIEQCSNSKLNAKKRAMWQEFLVDTVSNLGQSTSTGSIVQAVGGLTSGGGGMSSLGTLGSFVTQKLMQ